MKNKKEDAVDLHAMDLHDLIALGALRYPRVKLVLREWDIAADVCKLDIIRDKEVIGVDSHKVYINLRKAPPIDFGCTANGTVVSVSKFLQNQMRAYVEQLLDGLVFSIKLVETQLPTVFFSLSVCVGELPPCVHVPSTFEGSWRAFAPMGSPEERAYLDAMRPKAQAANEALETVASAINLNSV